MQRHLVLQSCNGKGQQTPDCLVVALLGVVDLPVTGDYEQWATGNVSERLNT